MSRLSAAVFLQLANLTEMGPSMAPAMLPSTMPKTAKQKEKKLNSRRPWDVPAGLVNQLQEHARARSASRVTMGGASVLDGVDVY